MSHFAALRSFVDLSFFAKLSEHKLEVAKLSEQELPLLGFANVPLQPSRAPALRLTDDSIQPGPQDESTASLSEELGLPGNILNVNTIEAFKELNKASLIRAKAQELAAKIRSGEALQSPNELLRFFVISFADLKKYKYYYWFAFPSFSWQSKAEWTGNADPELNTTIFESQEALKLFFVLERSENGWRVGALSELSARNTGTTVSVGLVDFGSSVDSFPWQLRNFAALLANLGFTSANVYVCRDHPRLSSSGSALASRWVSVDLVDSIDDTNGIVGWERNSQNKLVPKITDLASLSDPHELANQAVDLNLRLMKWRAAPSIDLDAVKNQKCLLLGAGTLGSYVARGLMAWGVRHITFVDNGTVSYSNPVRQPLYTLEDSKAKAPKAEVAARSLKEIFPGVTSSGHALSIAMAGHAISEETVQKEEYDKLVGLLESHDAVFLLMDSRESRWLPTVICQSLEKLVINVAIGFDSFLAMRHGLGAKQGHGSDALGCYFCNDVVAPIDSVSRLTLDQMCTVTRPGVAQLASGFAVELFATVTQHAQGAYAPADQQTVLGPTTHQLRGFLGRREVLSIRGAAFKSCSGCGAAVVDAWEQEGWAFVKRALNDPTYVTELSGLGDLQRQAEELDLGDSGEEFA